MVKIEGYASLSQKQEDLLRLGYAYKSLAAVTLFTSANPVNFKARAAQKTDGSFLASSSLKLKKDDLVFTPKRRTDGLSQYTLEYAFNPDVKARAECRITETKDVRTRESTASVEYRQPEYVVNAALVEPNLALKLSATWQQADHGLGVDGKFAFDSNRFVSYNFALWHVLDKQTVVFKHAGSDKSQYALGEVTFSYYKETSDNTRIGAVAKYDIPKRANFIEFGGDYRIDNQLTLRGKISSEGLLGLGLTKKLQTWVNLTVGAQFNTAKLTASTISDYKFGFKLDFNTVFQ